MKKVFIIILVMCSLTAWAQDLEPDTKQRLDSFVNLYQSMEQQLQEAYAQGDTARITELDYLAIATIDANSDFLSSIISKRQLNSLKGNMFYDLACINARQGKIEAGFYHLTEAVRFDYNDWKHIGEDHDLDNLRSDARLDSIVAQIRARADFLEILKQSAPYTHTTSAPTPCRRSPTSRPTMRACNASEPILNSTAWPATEMRFPESRTS